MVLNGIKLISLRSRLGFFSFLFFFPVFIQAPNKELDSKIKLRAKENVLVAEVTELTIDCKNQNWRPWWSICIHLQPGPPVFGSNGITVYSEEHLLLAGHDMSNVLTLK